MSAGPPHLDPETLGAFAADLVVPLAEHARRFPGDGASRQPAHTVYGGAQLFQRDTVEKLGTLALRTLDRYAATPADLAAAIGLDAGEGVAASVHARVRAKLEREPVEDFRIDFEDGFGDRPDAEEDETAVRAARETAEAWSEDRLPPFVGIRVKPFTSERLRRGLRTLDLFVGTLVEASGGTLPPGFVITLPKVVHAEQVATLADALDRLETEIGLEPGSLHAEIMVETPQSIIAPDGTCPLPRFVESGRGRVIGAHFGVYDYTASTSITAEHQGMRHPICDHARQTMLVALAGTGVLLSDGATNLLPVPVHRAVADGDPLSARELAENRAAVHGAWRLHFEDVTHSLINGFYQGWDLHPAQLVTRYAALYSFFLRSLGAATERLSRFVERAAQATLTGDVFDDAATGQGLLNFFLRGLACGALTPQEVERTGITTRELRTRSFARIVEARGGA